MTTLVPNSDSRATKKSVAYFCTEVEEAAHQRRLNGLNSLGFSITLVGYERRRFDNPVPPVDRLLILGYMKSGAYFRRLLTLFTGVFKLLRLGRYLKSQDYYYARNLDAVLMALLMKRISRSGAKIIYEVIDIRAIMQKHNIIAKLFRWLERKVLAKSQLLVVTSPGYIDHYFHPVQGFHGRWWLLENKLCYDDFLTPRDRIAPASKSTPPRGPWVIGWFGTLRCEKSFRMLCSLASKLGKDVEIHMAGVPDIAGSVEFEEEIDRHDNITFGGRYSAPRDLPALYNKVHFVWGIELTAPKDPDDQNSKWLLLTRLYEGGYFKVPILTVRGTYNAVKVEHEGTGWAFDEPLEENTENFLRRLAPDSYWEQVKKLEDLPQSVFRDEGEDLAALFADNFNESELRARSC